jgi:hypothetical protein
MRKEHVHDLHAPHTPLGTCAARTDKEPAMAPPAACVATAWSAHTMSPGTDIHPHTRAEHFGKAILQSQPHFASARGAHICTTAGLSRTPAHHCTWNFIACIPSLAIVFWHEHQDELQGNTTQACCTMHGCLAIPRTQFHLLCCSQCQSFELQHPSAVHIAVLNKPCQTILAFNSTHAGLLAGAEAAHSSTCHLEHAMVIDRGSDGRAMVRA